MIWISKTTDFATALAHMGPKMDDFLDFAFNVCVSRGILLYCVCFRRFNAIENNAIIIKPFCIWSYILDFVLMKNAFFSTEIQHHLRHFPIVTRHFLTFLHVQPVFLQLKIIKNIHLFGELIAKCAIYTVWAKMTFNIILYS